MANSKLTDLSHATILEDDDLLYVVQDVGGDPESKSIEFLTLKSNLNIIQAARTYYVGFDVGVVTMTIASPCVVSKTAHGLSINDPIIFRTTGALPTGITAGTVYYIISAGFTANSFRVSTTLGGAAVNTSGSQSGVHSAQTGNDNNTGLTTGRAGAFLTIQKAADSYALLRNGGFDVTAQLCDGLHYGNVVIKSGVGGGALIFEGNSSTPDNVVVSAATGSVFQLTNIYTITKFHNFKLGGIGSATTGINATGAVTYFEWKGINFSTGMSTTHINASDGVSLQCTGNYTISGGTAAHFRVQSCVLRMQNFTITITGTPAITDFLIANRWTIAVINGNTFSGSATGKRYSIDNAYIITNNAGETYLPGNAAGTIINSGSYDNHRSDVTTYQALPGNPTGTTSTTGVMMGIAGAITPVQTGKIMIIISGTMANNTLNDGAKSRIRYGTGSAPTNGAALTGTTAGGLVQSGAATGIFAGTKFPFSLNAIVSGLTLGTALWIDIELAAITGGTATVTDLSVSVVEI